MVSKAGSHSQQDAPPSPFVGLFVTCLVDLMRPSIGFAAVKLLEQSGCQIDVPAQQTCCGQPNYNSGDRTAAQNTARQVIAAFANHDYVVAPSGSCAGMLKKHYPLLLADDEEWAERAQQLSAKTYELVSFLVDVLGVKNVTAHYDGRVTYHDACSGLRELGIKHQPRNLLKTVTGLELCEMDQTEVCCGFGGTFSAKYSDISNAMVENKAKEISATKPDMIVAGDLGCLMNIAGKLSRQGKTGKGDGIEVRHVAEVLSGDLSHPAIGAAAQKRR